MFTPHFSHLLRLTRTRPWSSLLALLCLAPLISCANEPYLAQNGTRGSAAYGQQNVAAPPAYAAPANGQFLAPPQVAELVARIALYPDDLIGIILPASTYPLQIVQASRYLDAVRSNTTLSPDDSWDNAVVALLNYPDVIAMMNRELAWTERLGQAVIMQQSDVITAIGQFRAQVQAAGNLRSDERQVVEFEQGAIRIRPADPQVIYVPQYEPTRVIVYSSEPAFGYYPRPCPVYYYNYAAGYPSGFSNFWGVSTLFTIGWSNSRLRLHDYDYYDDPRFDRPYNGYFYRRSYHGWHDDDGPTWGGDDDGDGRGHHGRGERPRERDWQPRPVAVGGRPHHDNGGDGGRFVPPPTVQLPAPTRTIREGSTRGMQPIGGESSVRRTPSVTPAQAPNEARTFERGNSFAPSDGESGVRRRLTVVPNEAPDQAQRFDRGRSYSPPPALDTRSGSEPTNVRRGSSLQGERREFAPAPMAPPEPRMRMPPPQRFEREATMQPRYSPMQPAPSHSGRTMDDGRNSARMAPSRPEPRMAPSRPEPRLAPSRAESRAPVASSRRSEGPTATRRGGDEDRGRGSRDR